MKAQSPLFKSAEAESRMLAVYDTAMKLWPLPFEEHTISTQYGKTHVITSGPKDAPPLVLLHCALMTSAIWSPIIEALSKQHRTYAVDVMGDVGRTIPSNPPVTEKEFANWLEQVLDGFHLEKTSILAWSFGGFVGTNFTLHHPQRVVKLGLLAPFATFIRPGPGFLLGFLPFLFPLRPFVRLFERSLCHKPSFGYKEHSEILYERFRSARVVFKVPPRVFKDQELQSLGMPILLLIGEQEFLYNSKAAIERARRLFPKGNIELIKNCNHAIVSDQTQIVRDRLVNFF